jgi:hypothetical protein
VSRITIQVLLVAFTVLFFGPRGEACYQTSIPYVQLRSRVLAGTITLDGKPIGGAVLKLRLAGKADPRLQVYFFGDQLRDSTTDNYGFFSFGSVPYGKYLILMAHPSNESTEVELVAPKKDEADKIAIEFYADLCQRASAISADGLKPRHR